MCVRDPRFLYKHSVNASRDDGDINADQEAIPRGPQLSKERVGASSTGQRRTEESNARTGAEKVGTLPTVRSSSATTTRV